MELDLKELGDVPLSLEHEYSREEVDALLSDVEELRLGDEVLPVYLEAMRIGESIQLRGDLCGEFLYVCGRCMRERPMQIDMELEFYLMPRGHFSDLYEGEEELELSEEDMDVSFFDEGESVALDPLIREAILLDLPALLACPPEDREGCDAALEAFSGGRFGDMKEEAEVDIRWSALKDIKLGEDKSNGESS